jgi:hypothetical protein
MVTVIGWDMSLYPSEHDTIITLSFDLQYPRLFDCFIAFNISWASESCSNPASASMGWTPRYIYAISRINDDIENKIKWRKRIEKNIKNKKSAHNASTKRSLFWIGLW